MSLYDRRLVLFSGKGGVGKTTLASAFALSCAMRGKRTLLIELNVKDRLTHLFGSTEVGAEIAEIEENLFAVNITPSAALEEFGMMTLRLRMLYKAVFENRLVRSFLKVIPGLPDLVMLGKVHYHAEKEVDDRGDFVWDMVVVDAPATGHGIFFLKIPSVITSLVQSGPMFTDAKRIDDYIKDPSKTALNLVTLPEEMPVNETLMMRDVMRQEMKIPLGFVAANTVYPAVFDADEAAVLEAVESPDGEEAHLAGFLDAARFRAQRVAMQRHYCARLDEAVELPVVHIPYYFTERFDFQTIRKIALELLRQLDPTAYDAFAPHEHDA